MIFKRPWPLFFLVVGLVFFTGFQMIRMGQAVALWTFLSSLPIPVSPLYQAATGLGWGVFAVLAARQLWGGKPGARRLTSIFAVTYALYYWLEQLFLMENPLRSTRWAFSGGVTVFLLLFVFSSLYYPSVSVYFGEHNEQEEQG